MIQIDVFFNNQSHFYLSAPYAGVYCHYLCGWAGITAVSGSFKQGAHD